MSNPNLDILDNLSDVTSLNDVVDPTDTEDDEIVDIIESLSTEQAIALFEELNMLPESIQLGNKMIFPEFCEQILDKPLYDIHYRIYLFQEINPFAITHAPIDHWKTTVSTYVILYNYYLDPLMTYLYFSASDKMATRVVNFIKYEIENNKLLQDAGVRKPVKPSTWSSDSITIDRPYRSNWPASLSAYGIFGNYYGAKAHCIVGDDICNLENSRTETRRHHLKNKFLKEAASRVTAYGKTKGRIWLIGSVVDKEDLLCDLAHNIPLGKSRWKYLCLAAADEATETAICPEIHDYDWLMSIKADSPLLYRMGYQNEKISINEHSIVPEELVLRCFNPARSLREFRAGRLLSEHPEDRSEADLVTISVDLSVISNRQEAEAKNSSYFCAGCWFMKKNNNDVYTRHLVDMVHDRGITEKDRLDVVYNMYMLYRPDVIVVEKNQYQAVFIEHLELMGIPRHVLLGHTTTGSKMHPEHGIPAMRLYFERKEFDLPYRQSEDKILMGLLKDEFSQFGYIKRTDIVMMCYLNEKALEHPPGRKMSNVNWSFGRVKREGRKNTKRSYT